MADPIADNPMLMDMINQLTPFNFVMFYQQFPDLVVQSDWDKLKKSSIGIARNIVFSIVLGVVANVQIKRIPKLKFLEWRKPLRYAFRPIVFMIPYALILRKSTESHFIDLMNLHEKYYRVVYKSQRLGDPRIILNPASYRDSNN